MQPVLSRRDPHLDVDDPDGQAAKAAGDLLELDGQDLRREPLETRKATLASLLRGCRPGVRLNEHLEHDDGAVVAIRLGQWKAVFLENRADAFQIWREPFTELRIPLLFNLRRDPFEKAQIDANVYHDWFLERPFVVVPMQQIAGKFFQTLAEYPLSQTPGSFNLEKIQEQIESSAAGK